MTYIHGIPNHADARSYKFYRHVYVGKNDGKNGEDESGHKMSWDSRHEDLKPSKTYGQNYCVYCGKRPMPIQPDHLGYEVSGYMCVCKDAQDELELNDQIEKLIEKQRKELSEIKGKLPKASEEVKRKIVESKLKDVYYLDKALEALNIK